MSCLFLENVPDDVEWKPEYLSIFHERVAVILGNPLEVHVRRGVTYSMLTPEGEVDGIGHGVHGWVYWHEGRTEEQRRSLGCEVQVLLRLHGIAKGMDITFVDGVRGVSFFVEVDLVP